MKLFLDLSESKVAKVQLRKDKEIIDETVGNKPLLLIDQILKKHHLKLTDLEEIESYPGPGSFTGLKVSATIANIINWQLGNNKIIKPIYQVKPGQPLLYQPISDSKSKE